MPTTVVHVKRSPYDIYIGRANPRHGLPASKWANPFRLEKGGDREACLALYRAWLLEQPELMAALPELRDKVLACWCGPQRCHGDVLAELANDLDLDVCDELLFGEID